MIHTATLIHDDVLDEAEQRRHLPTVHARWGNKTAILLGDLLFTHAFHSGRFGGSTGLPAHWIGHQPRLCRGTAPMVRARALASAGSGIPAESSMTKLLP
ncbi:MAG: hypothetical protein KatS3mg107_0770 [Gemmataceae bacterium]|nr:MAG: hypothetical protein KatS3mg107_0770 [Gemmataceae bacterium]